MVSYVERPPIPALAGVVRTVWTQRTSDTPYVQRHLPTGGVELHLREGGAAVLLGPLTGPRLELIPPHTTIHGVRFFPGAAPPLPLPLAELVDQQVDWPFPPISSLADLQAALVRGLVAARPDPLVRSAVRGLMPWRPVPVDAVASAVALSPSQLRRRFLQSVGLTPKVLQRTLRFQGFLALAQAGRTNASELAAELGYADQAHLSRECLRLTGLTPRALLGDCLCGHDHAAAYRPFLASRALFVQERRLVRA